MEQKNGAVVRHMVGYRRYEGLEAAAALADLYRSLRLFVNFFQPSFKLAEKSRNGAKVTKGYHAPATPHQRLMSDPRTAAATRERVAAVYATLDPVRSAERDQDWPTAACGDRRPSRVWREPRADRADAGGVPVGPTDGMAGRRGAPDQQTQGEGQAWPASSGSARGSDGAVA